jgi:hypothetical protein
MPTWLILAKGPAFFFILAILLLGLGRLVVLTLWDISEALSRAADRRVPYTCIGRQMLSWLVPFRHLGSPRAAYRAASFALHAGILVVGFFLANHLEILQEILGLSWVSISKPVLDILTLIAICGGFFLLLSRLYVLASRHLSRFPDFLLIILLLNIFISGFVAGQSWNPIPYDGLMLFHTLNGMALLLTVPFTKIAHCVLFPLIRVGTEVAWHFPPGAGSHAVQAIHGPEGRKI